MFLEQDQQAKKLQFLHESNRRTVVRFSKIRIKIEPYSVQIRLFFEVSNIWKQVSGCVQGKTVDGTQLPKPNFSVVTNFEI